MKAPKIRFKGFEGAWEEKKLGESLIVSKEKNIDNYYTKEDVLSVSWEFWVINQIEFQWRSFAWASVSNYWIVNFWDVVYTKSPLKLNPYWIIKSNKWKTWIVSVLYAIYKSKDNCDPNFIQLYFEQNARLNNYLRPLISKWAKNTINVSDEDALQWNVIFPSLSEQEKIWSLFEQLDSHISKNQQKLEKLKNMKQSFLQKLFPKDWSALPKMRFKGFEGAWEERKLGEIWSILTWSTPSTSIKNNYSENWMLRVTPTDIKNNTIKETAKKLSFNWQQVARIVPKYSILVTCIASIWKNTMLLAEWSFNQQINALVPNPERTNSYFLLSESEIRSNKMKNRASSWTMQIVNKSEFSNISTFIPSLPEQEKIWAFFEKLDTQITQQTQKIQKLQNLKQSLLEKMFI